MLSATLRLSHGDSVTSSSLSQGRRIASRARVLTARRTTATVPQTRSMSTVMGATAKGTANFFSEERQQQRLRDLKSRLESKRVLTSIDGEGSSNLPPIGELKAPLLKPKHNAKTGWTMGPIGFGTYRISSQSMDHQNALELALQTGATNVIDCSPNYGKESESLVGQTLRNLIDARRLDREEVIVTSKIGPLLQGAALDPVKQRAAKGRPFHNMKLLAPELGYCLEPEYIEFQLTRTLKAMQLDCIDLLMIDMPELLLPSNPSENVLGQLYRLLQTTMTHLEEEVKRGRIQHYGVSSTSFSSLHRPGEARISLDMLTRTASTLPNSHFAAIEYPYNIMEPQSAHNDLHTDETDSINWSQQGRGNSVQMHAYEAGLIQLGTRPLNALINTEKIFTHIPTPTHSFSPTGMMYRLAGVPMHDGPALAPIIKSTINGTVALEQSYALEYGKITNNPMQKEAVAAKPLPHPREFSWAQIILSNLSRLDLATFKTSWEHQMRPGLVKSVDALRRSRPDMEYWASNYEKSLTALAEQYTKVLETNRAQEVADLTASLENACPSLKENASISSKAVRVASSSFATALVGMRTEDYVLDLVYGGGTPEAPAPMTRLDPSLFGAIFDVGSRHSQNVRDAIKTQLSLEEEMSVKSRREAAEDRILSEALAPKPTPPKAPKKDD